MKIKTLLCFLLIFCFQAQAEFEIHKMTLEPCPSTRDYCLWRVQLWGDCATLETALKYKSIEISLAKKEMSNDLKKQNCPLAELEETFEEDRTSDCHSWSRKFQNLGAVGRDRQPYLRYFIYRASCPNKQTNQEAKKQTGSR